MPHINVAVTATASMAATTAIFTGISFAATRRRGGLSRY